jgi:hypothetical protein
MFGRGNFQGVRDQFRDLNGGPPLIVFDLAKHGRRTPNAPGKFFAREPVFVALLTKPFSESIHFPLAQKL